ncbi:MAG: hypothetical protein WBU92_11030 [Candidatus Dormiibacterota bacterium]
MRFERFTFGSIRIDGVVYRHDLVIDRGEIRKRKKSASKEYRSAYGHTPLSIKEDIPWHCRRLVVGTGAQGALPVMDDVLEEAKRCKVELLSVPTEEAIAILNGSGKATNAILHLTC